MISLLNYFTQSPHLKWIGLVSLLILVASCSSQKTIRPGDTLEEAYKKANTLYENNEYSKATRAYETVISIGRGTDIGEEAQYKLAESYFKNEEYLLAASEYDRYTTLYPQSERRNEADFKQAMCFYHLSPRYNLSQQHTRQAIDLFELYISRYPDSDKVQQASDYIDKLRAKLAHKMYEAAKLYQRTDEYEAATIYYGMTTDNYPETKWAEKAKVDQIFAYIQFARRSVQSKQAERYQKAINSYEKYLQLFPEGPNREQAEQYLNIAENELGSIHNGNRKALSNKDGNQPESDNS